MLRINLSVDEESLKDLDYLSKSKNQNRSKIIREAIQIYKNEFEKQKLDLKRKQNILEAIKIQNELKKYSKGWDGVFEIRKWRESR